MKRLFALLVALAAPMVTSAQPLEPGDFERLLLPLTALNAPGAYGSIWSTELWSFAERGKGVHYEPFFPVCNPPCEDFNSGNGLYGIPEDNSYQAGILITKPGETPGGYLYMLNGSLPYAQFSLQLKEMTGMAQTIQLPVVHQSAFSGSAIRILGVPAQSFNRSTLRIYGADPDIPGLVRVRVYTEPFGFLVSETTYAVTATQRLYMTRYGQSIPTKPPAVEIGNFLAGANSPTVWLEIVPLTQNLRVWGFISVTDNRTQEVVLRTPGTS